MADGGKDRETRIRDILDGITLFERVQVRDRQEPAPAPRNTKGYSSTYLAMGFANVRAGTWYKRALEYLSRYGIR